MTSIFGASFFSVFEFVFLNPSGQLAILSTVLTNLLQHEIRQSLKFRYELKLHYLAQQKEAILGGGKETKAATVSSGRKKGRGKIWVAPTLTFLATLLVLLDPVRRLVFQSSQTGVRQFMSPEFFVQTNTPARRLQFLGYWFLGLARLWRLAILPRLLRLETSSSCVSTAVPAKKALCCK